MFWCDVSCWCLCFVLTLGINYIIYYYIILLYLYYFSSPIPFLFYSILSYSFFPYLLFPTLSFILYLSGLSYDYLYYLIFLILSSQHSFLIPKYLTPHVLSEWMVEVVEDLTLGVYYILYIILLYYTLYIIIYYILYLHYYIIHYYILYLYYTSSPFLFFLSPLPIYSSNLISSLFFPILFLSHPNHSSHLPFFLSSPSQYLIYLLFLFLILIPSQSSQYSFYTCRYLDIAIYISLQESDPACFIGVDG